MIANETHRKAAFVANEKRQQPVFPAEAKCCLYFNLAGFLSRWACKVDNRITIADF